MLPDPDSGDGDADGVRQVSNSDALLRCGRLLLGMNLEMARVERRGL